MNLASMLDHQARRKPDHPAVVEGDRTVTHRAFAPMVRRWAAALQDSGLRAGDVIGIDLGDTADHLVANWAVARLGGIILPMDHRWTAAEKNNVVAGFGAAAVIGEGTYPDTRTVALDATFRATAAGLDGDRPFPEDEDLPLVLSLSSGTTGTPKGPALTHRHMRARWIAQFVSLGLTEHDRYLSATPLYFGGGRSFTMSATWAGATVVMFPPPYEPEALVAAAADSRATTTLLVPTILRRLLSLPTADRPLFPTLRVLMSTGAILHADERATVMARLCPGFINYYGSTEGGGVSILTPAHGADATGSVGQVIFGTDVEIVDAADRPVPAGEVGRIRYRGDGVAGAFYRNPAASSEAFRDGWFYPGDLGRLDSRGFLHLAGRDRDVIIRGGANVYPAEIESVLLGHAGVTDAAVVGWPARDLGEDIAAFAVAGGEVAEADLIALCRQRLAPYKVPRRIFLLETLPKSPLGKVRKEDLVSSLPEWSR